MDQNNNDRSVYDLMKSKGYLQPNGNVANIGKSRVEERADMTNQKRIDSVALLMRDKFKLAIMGGCNRDQAIAQLVAANEITSYMVHQIHSFGRLSAQAALDTRLGNARERAVMLLPGLEMAFKDLKLIAAGIHVVLVELGVDLSTLPTLEIR